MSNLRTELTRHANTVERNRTDALEWLAGLINRQKFETWYGNEAILTEEIVDVLYSVFDEAWSIEIMKNSQKLIVNLTGKGVDARIPTTRLNLIRDRFNLIRTTWLADFAIKMAKLNNAMPVEMLQADFVASMPQMKVTKGGEDRFVSGYSKYYGSLWRELAKAVDGEYRNLSTWYTMQCMEQSE